MADVAVMFRLPLFVDHAVAGIVLTEGEDEGTLQLLNAALRVLKKATYTSWIRYSNEGKGVGRGDCGSPAFSLDLA